MASFFYSLETFQKDVTEFYHHHSHVDGHGLELAAVTWFAVFVPASKH